MNVSGKMLGCLGAHCSCIFLFFQMMQWHAVKKSQRPEKMVSGKWILQFEEEKKKSSNQYFVRDRGIFLKPIIAVNTNLIPLSLITLQVTQNEA